MRAICFSFRAVLIFLSCANCSHVSDNVQPASTDEIRYLIFQIFTYNPSSNGDKQPLDGVAIRNQVSQILAAVDNNRGDGVHKQIGFAAGPLSLDHTDDELRAFIRESFAIAEEKEVAVAFHIDDSMFWIDRPDLWQNPDNVEWSDWSGTVFPQRYISWAPVVLAPQMCYNSPGIKKEIERIARDVIGAEIKNGIDHLRKKNKEKLFAGVINGWETHLADHRYIDVNDSVANQLGIQRKRIGYHALTNLGYSSTNPPADIDAVLERVVYDFADYWAIKLGEANIPADRIYTHIAFPVFPQDQQQMMLDQLSIQLGFMATILGFTHTTPGTAFNGHSRAGFSTYPIGFKENNVDARLSRILTEFKKQGGQHWASTEGTNVQGESAAIIASHISWDEYINGMFDNGATLVNIFAWSDPTGYGTATRSAEAIEAYKKFLQQ